MGSDKALAWKFTEDSVQEELVIQAGRRRAEELGAHPVSAGTGAALRMLAASCGAKAVAEVGTGAVISSAWLLQGMPTDAVLTSIDVESEFHKAARVLFREAGIGPQRTRLITGQALNVLPRMAARAYDMVVIDADLHELEGYLEHARRMLRPGGILAIPHALWGDQVADPARRDPDTVAMRELVKTLRADEELVTTVLPVGDGLLVAITR